METYVVRPPGGLDRLEIVERDDSGEPGPGEVRVAIHATSLNFHDLLVANGGIPTEDGRVLVADGAGVVEAVGAGVAEFAPGDHVVSTFFQHWIAGRPFTAVGNFAGTPGDGIDGMAATHVVRPVSAFTRAPKGWSHPEAATITTFGLTAWRALVIDGALQAGQTVLTLGSGGVSLAALQLAKAMGAHVAATFSSDEKFERLPRSCGGALDAD
ncbi:NAD(P)-dependent alcohol dehydrogenase [Rhizobium sp. P28RR-XV]|uniref:zinc-dependent alcohol dehydrogenase family protein n=1 Tax=Rhizobium sp. P28RR-XV TaxID=2726737 RepID=UPI001456CFB1|nr:NAD(P)-dependent alcohol dehydrogenase [Rhizobium sp. P28RR-XV]NLR88289.1 NAD(P)-dependent alcohol dehydrogenase [Rhizobium sp. P28RR-XV]